mmetsp:Transcript_11183/g.39642  ORF Transcript_11183/g.39642 Transcript_11183/m.39642 type:complete len:119 (-) Transcript_11183:2-358(-)
MAFPHGVILPSPAELLSLILQVEAVAGMGRQWQVLRVCLHHGLSCFGAPTAASANTELAGPIFHSGNAIAGMGRRACHDIRLQTLCIVSSVPVVALVTRPCTRWDFRSQGIMCMPRHP